MTVHAEDTLGTPCQCDQCRLERAAVETVSRQCLEHGGVEYVPEEVE